MRDETRHLDCEVSQQAVPGFGAAAWVLEAVISFKSDRNRLQTSRQQVEWETRQGSQWVMYRRLPAV